MNALAKKLYVKPNTNWLIYNAPLGYLNLLEPLADGVKLVFDVADDIDGIQVFIKSMADLKKGLAVIKEVAKAEIFIWVTYPKKSSGVKSDLNLDMENNWPEVTIAGLETVALVSVDATWSAVRLRPIGQAKRSGVGNEQVKQNDYGQYMMWEKRVVTLPPDVQEALQIEPAAMAAYEKLAYSHRKEYIIWILSAKQQTTRDTRLVKMVDMLLSGKKNPSDK